MIEPTIFGPPLPDPSDLSVEHVAACAETFASMAVNALERSGETGDPRDAFMAAAFAWWRAVLDEHLAVRVSAAADGFRAIE